MHFIVVHDVKFEILYLLFWRKNNNKHKLIIS